MTFAHLPRQALTLYQPYAWLVAEGYKPIENRPEGFSQRNFRGPFWVHAGLERKPEVWQQARELCDRLIGKEFALPSFDDLPVGCIVGRAAIVGMHYPVTTLWRPREPVRWHFPEQYGLILEAAQKLERPVACRGFQGFWPVPDQVLEVLAKEVLPCA